MTTRLAALLALGALLLGGCGRHETPRATSAPTPWVSPAPARSGIEAASQRSTFVPEEITLPSGDDVKVTPAVTIKGALEVPAAADTAGWWDGSSRAGEPFGSMVIAGHVDTAATGLAPFSQLLRSRVGDVISVAGSGQRLNYRVMAVDIVDKDVLSTSSTTLSQRGDHRLSLITCTGSWDRATRRYDSNLVVTAMPTGRPRTATAR